MRAIDQELEAEQLLRQVAEETRARSILRKPVRTVINPLAYLAFNFAALLAVLSGIEASFWVKCMLVTSFALSLSAAWEVARLAKRVDALTILALRERE